MKKLLFVTMFVVIAGAVMAQKSHRKYTFKKEVPAYSAKDTSYTDLTEYIDMDSTIVIDSTKWFSPVANITVMYFNADNYKVGVVPGVGYGFNWKPDSYKGNKEYLLSLQAFLQAGVSNYEVEGTSSTYLTLGPSVGVGFLGGLFTLGYSPTWDIKLGGSNTEFSGMFFISTTLISF